MFVDIEIMNVLMVDCVSDFSVSFGVFIIIDDSVLVEIISTFGMVIYLDIECLLIVEVLSCISIIDDIHQLVNVESV